MIKKRGNKWYLYSKSTGKLLGSHASEEEAKAQEAAINISKARRAGHKIPKKRKKA